MSDHTGAKLLYPALPEAGTPIADKGHDSDAFRDALEAMGIDPCVPPRRKRRRACVHTFFSGICIAATVVFWLQPMNLEPKL